MVSKHFPPFPNPLKGKKAQSYVEKIAKKNFQAKSSILLYDEI